MLETTDYTCIVDYVLTKCITSNNGHPPGIFHLYLPETLTAHIMVNSETSVTEAIGASRRACPCEAGRHSIGQGKCGDPGECSLNGMQSVALMSQQFL